MTKRGDLFWTKVVLDTFLSSFVHDLVAYPVSEREQLMGLDLWATIDLLSNVRGQRSDEHDFGMLLADPVAVGIKEVHPVVDVLTELTHVGASRVLLKLGSACDLDELIAPFVFAEELAPQFKSVTFDVDPHLCSTNIQSGSDPSK